MSETSIIGRVIDVRSTTLRVALNVGSKGFTKVGTSGLQTVGVVNSYITVLAGAHRVVGIVTAVYIRGHEVARRQESLISEDEAAAYEFEATIVGRFEGKAFKPGLTGYPALHAPVRPATPDEVLSIFQPKGPFSLRIGTSAISTEQEVYLDANLLLGHHCAVVGSTGSGKSCTVSAILDGLLDHEIPNGHIVIFDINGEYAKAFAPTTARGAKSRPLILGPKPGTDSGLFLPHWFMNNEEHLNLLRAGEGVQAPVLQRAIADARVAGVSTDVDISRLQNLLTSMSIVQATFNDTKTGSDRALKQLESMQRLVDSQLGHQSPCHQQWLKIKRILDVEIPKACLEDRQWIPLDATQRDVLLQMLTMLRKEVFAALGVLGVGAKQASADFDAPVFYSMQELHDSYLPNRIQMEQVSDNKIAGYVATLQMRLSRLLADGRYNFITRVGSHDDPLGAYLKAIMGADPTDGDPNSDWPAASRYREQMSSCNGGPSVTIFDLSMVANDVLENVTALLGRILFDFVVRSDPRAKHPILLVLEEAHRFIPSHRMASVGESRSAPVFERIAKEGRKFGLSLLLASQRPSELSETVVAQCGTVIAHRLTHEADQNLLRHATAMSSRALLEQLPNLAQQHALVTGASTVVPVAVRIRDVEEPPKSTDPDFISAWTDADRLSELPGDIKKVAMEWQGSPP